MKKIDIEAQKTVSMISRIVMACVEVGRLCSTRLVV